MQERKEMPEEVKNQVIDGKKRAVIVPLPEKIMKIIEDKTKKRGALNQTFFKISFNIVKFQRVLQDLSKQMEDLDTSIKDRIEEGAKKLKLRKQKDRHWRFDGIGNWIGIYNPPPKKIVEKKEK